MREIVLDLIANGINRIVYDDLALYQLIFGPLLFELKSVCSPLLLSLSPSLATACTQSTLNGM